MVAVNVEDAEQVKVMLEPAVPSTLRVRVVDPLAGMVTAVTEGDTEKSGTLVNALIKAPTSGVPKPVTRS